MHWELGVLSRAVVGPSNQHCKTLLYIVSLVQMMELSRVVIRI